MQKELSRNHSYYLVAFQVPPLDARNVRGRKLERVQPPKLSQQLLRRDVVQKFVLV